MCGLAGFARHPEADLTPQHRKVLTELLGRMRHRGRHATGVAFIDTRLPEDAEQKIWKKAIPVDAVVNSELWHRVLEDNVTPDRTVILGHVRHATQNNHHRDDCAHPFQLGPVVGAHNGMFYNWQELARKFSKDGPSWQVDTEAGLYLLERFEDVNKAMDYLDGYWALTWTRGKHLYITRTNDAQLCCAYVPKHRTLLWASERSILAQTLHGMGIDLNKEADVWEPQPNTIYRYDPTAFDEHGTNGEKTDATFRGRRKGKHDTRATMGSCAVPERGGYSTTRTVTVTGEQTELPWREGGKKKGGQKAASFSGVLDHATLNRIMERLDLLERENADLTGRLEVAEAELEHLMNAVSDAGLLDLPDPLPDVPEIEEEDLQEGPFTDEVLDGRPADGSNPPW